jgi:hypothetical protein
MSCERCLGGRILALSAVSAAIISGCANPVLDSVLGRNTAAPPALPANVIVSLSLVRQEFPMMSRVASTAADPMAPGMPRATRRSQFTNLTAMGRLTVAVAEYACEQTAYSAFTDLVQDLRYTPGSVGLGRPDVGHDALATLIRSLAVPKGVTVAAREQRLIVQLSSTGFSTAVTISTGSSGWPSTKCPLR